MSSVNDLAVLTIYCNPFCLPHRRARYDAIRDRFKALGVPLYTAEITFGQSPFELQGETILPLRCADMIWQGERAFNIMLTHLVPRDITTIAWMLSDAVITDDEWPAKVKAALQTHGMVQAFDRVVSPDGTSTLGSIASLKTTGGVAESDPGRVWAARRTVLEGCGFFDALVTGGGEYALLYGALFDQRSPLLWSKAALELDLFRSMSRPLRAHFMRWTERVQHALTKVGESAVGAVHSQIAAIPPPAAQNTVARFAPLKLLDPKAHLTLASNKSWAWSAPPDEVRSQVKASFFSQYGES